MPAGERAPGARQAVRLLRFLATQRGAVSAATVARALELPRSSTYHLLTALVEEGVVAHLAEEHRYSLGLAAFELSSGYLRQAPLGRLGSPVLAGLVDRWGESAHLAVLHGRHVVYVLEERAAHRPALVSDVGVRLPAQLTASGRAMLAALSAEQLLAVFPDRESLRTDSGRLPSSLRDLRAVLARVHDDGYAVEREDITAGLASVALALYDNAGWPLAAIATTFPLDRYPEPDWSGIAERMRPYVAELQRRLTGPHRGRRSSRA